MPILVSRNTIKLAAGASATDDYYLDHKVILTRIDALGKQTVQTKEIVDYQGSTRIAVIDGLWDAEYTPAPGDTVQIVPKYPDARVSINPAIQSLDYITSKTYGRGLDARKDLKLDTWLNSARICDTRSDIYVKYTGTAPTVGSVYGYNDPGIFLGKVAEVINGYVRFTEVIGKLSYKWNNWRDYRAGTLVYHQTRLYAVDAGGIKTAEPTHTSGTVEGLRLLNSTVLTLHSGPGVATIALSVDGNPIRFEKDGAPVSGYTLYDSDGVDYHKLIGWNSPDQREVTRHQTNLSVDTSLPLFDNMNSMLEHFGGILRYSGDKYVLEVEERADTIANTSDEPRNITEDHIIGKISISDDGIRSSYNSLTVAYSDPSNKFEARNISFFNSEYLKADRNVPKKGNLTIPGVTNYYNARILADKYLTRSRYGVSISLNIAPRGILLLAGKVIQLQYPRYGWINKKFRIENLTHNDDCTVDIVATEYDDSFYVISNIAKQPGTGLAGATAMTTISPPSALTATNVNLGNELVSAVELNWVDNPAAASSNVSTEIYASYSPYIELEIDTVTDGKTLITTSNHGMNVGQAISVPVSGYNLIGDQLYYIKTIPAANSFTLAPTRGGAEITNLVNTGNNFKIFTAIIIGNVNPPRTSFVDKDIFDITGTRVEKYYWLRYRINQQ